MKSTQLLELNGKTLFSSAIFFPALLFFCCVLYLQVDFVLQAFFVRECMCVCVRLCATFESFRLNSCENKFKQIVHRLYAFVFVYHSTNWEYDILRNGSIFLAFSFIFQNFMLLSSIRHENIHTSIPLHMTKYSSHFDISTQI